MHKCLKIILSGAVSTDFLRLFVQQEAAKLMLEGTAQVLPEASCASLIICGQKERLDNFVDLLHQHAAREGIDSVEIEPFLKTKDYRGVFRIIE